VRIWLEIDQPILEPPATERRDVRLGWEIDNDTAFRLKIVDKFPESWVWYEKGGLLPGSLSQASTKSTSCESVEIVVLFRCGVQPILYIHVIFVHMP
jgi:hypothetical protein